MIYEMNASERKYRWMGGGGSFRSGSYKDDD